MLKSIRSVFELRSRVAELETALAELESKNRELEAKNEELEAENRRLSLDLEEALRASHRQASPFRRGERKRTEDRKKPGRKPGHPGSVMQAPAEPAAERHAEKPAGCPNGVDHRIANIRRHENVEVEIPKVAPVVTRNVFWRFDCLDCGKRFESTHPDQISTATGAASVHLGPQARSLAAELKYGLGIPYRKCARILRDHFGIELTAGGLAQANAALAERTLPTVRAISRRLAESSEAYADETGWWTLAPAWLWVIATEQLTLYRISRSRNADLVKSVLGEEFAGRLMRDGMASYDARLSCSMLRCLRHVERNLEATERTLSGVAREQIGWLLGWVTAVWALRHESTGMRPERYQKNARELIEWFDWFTSDEELDPKLGDLQKRLAKLRDQIIPYVEDPALPATNNLAERQVRPAVIVRKISGGTRSQRGDFTFESLTTIGASAAQQGLRLSDVFAAILHAPRGQPILFWT